MTLEYQAIITILGSIGKLVSEGKNKEAIEKANTVFNIANAGLKLLQIQGLVSAAAATSMGPYIIPGYLFCLALYHIPDEKIDEIKEELYNLGSDTIYFPRPVAAVSWHKNVRRTITSTPEILLSTTRFVFRKLTRPFLR
ncbi:hypothetical protein NIES2101_41530 [Calothrix sp. HK-06]|nr:hypothetical protein NIES2101_41530 [Calothrix sp. HK-06]